MPKQTLKLAVLIVVIAMLTGAWFAHVINNAGNAAPSLQSGTFISPPREIVDFNLQGTHGVPATKSSFANHWSVLFFGYTTCPDVCPTTLAQLSDVHKALSNLPAELQPQFIFVSVDPKRDTLEKLSAYLNYFSPDFIGFTGPQPQLDTLTKSLGVPVIIQPLQDGSYTVDHSASLFVINPQQQLAAIFSPPYEAATLTRDLRALVKH
jgi:protein SCO1/2